MSARARATTSSVTTCCASRSRSARWPAPSLRRSRAVLANRPRRQQPRQEADRRKERVPLLPCAELDVRARMTVDLPRDIFRAAGIGRGGLGEADYGQRLALNAPAKPLAAPGSGGDGGDRGGCEPPVALRVGVDDGYAPALSLGAKL